MIVFTSSCLFNFALSLAKVNIATEQTIMKGAKMTNATSTIDSAIMSPKLLEFPPNKINLVFENCGLGSM